jgi:acyl-CoA synthetase (AMP-forming)/AMP-acid ligase II
MTRQISLGFDLEVPSQATILSMIAAAAERYPDRPALVDSTSGRATRYEELIDKVRRLASAFRARGAGPGSCIAVHGPNSADGVIAALGMAAAGGAFTGANQAVTAVELSRLIEITCARFLVTTLPLLATAREAASRAGAPELIVLDGKSDGTIALSQLLDGVSPLNDFTVGPETVAMRPCSSGTSGLPKAVELTHRALAAAALQVRAATGMRQDDTLLAVAPLFHIMGTAFFIGAGLTLGASIRVMPHYRLEPFLDAIERSGVTFLVATPPIMQALADHPAVSNYDLRRVRLIVCSGAATSAEVEKKVARRLGTVVTQAFGMTEMSGPIAFNPPQAPRPGSCGILVPSTEARIVDPNIDADKGAGEIGEIWVRGPQMMRGYFANVEATRAAFSPDGWLRTGDMGFFDADGYLHLVDRLKELIKVNAYQVAPTELEALIVSHPAVVDAAVLGRPDERTGEMPVAFVVPRSQIEANELITWVAARVAPYKKIQAVEFVDQIPRSPAGKILRRVLKDAERR